MDMAKIDCSGDHAAYHGALHILAVVPEFCAALVSEALIGDLRCSEEIAHLCGEAVDKVTGSH